MKDYDLAKLMMLGGALLLRLGAHSPEAYGAAGDVDLSFDLGSGVNGTVHAMALQADGKIIIGGEFTTVKGLRRIEAARLETRMAAATTVSIRGRCSTPFPRRIGACMAQRCSLTAKCSLGALSP